MSPCGKTMLLTRVVAALVLLQAISIEFAPRAADSIKVDEKNGTTRANSVSLAFEIDLSGRAIIPGLYDSLGGVITPIRGKQQFQELVLGRQAETTSGSATTHKVNGTGTTTTTAAWTRELVSSQTISLVQFYMATCPDCQGFSPYFKRFAQDIGPHWHKLVRVFVVNCNDFMNIHLCQEENPKLLVPMVRWYAYPIIQQLHHQQQQQHMDPLATSNQLSTSGGSSNQFSFSKSLLSIGHRSFVEKQRRDLISLRRATIRYIQLVLDELGRSRSSGGQPETIFDLLPMRWHLIGQLGRNHRESSSNSNSGQFLDDLNARLADCLSEVGAANASTIRNFIVFEPTGSFMGRTLVADWSNLTCSQLAVDNSVVMLHHTTDLSLLRRLKISHLDTEGTIPDRKRHGPLEVVQAPLLASFNVTASDIKAGRPLEDLDELEMRLLASNVTRGANHGDQLIGRSRAKRHSHAQFQRPERLHQRASLQRFYARSQPFRYASSMISGGKNLRKREVASIDKNYSNKTGHHLGDRHLAAAQVEAEHANWTPESVFPGEEALRYEFNRVLAGELNEQQVWPGSAGHQGEIRVHKPTGSRVIPPREDDLTLLLLTDYYKGLDEIVHTDLLSKGELDYYQLVASSCMLHELIKHFPYQGNVYAPDRVNQGLDGYYRPFKSIARQYLHLVREVQINELERRLNVGKLTISCSAARPRAHKPTTNGTSLHEDEANNNNNNSSKKHNILLLSSHTGNNSSATSSELGKETLLLLLSTTTTTSSSLGKRIDELRIPSRDLETGMAQIRDKYDTGLPAAKHFNWKYCLGTSSYLRGHTCSLWLLFHTLTVHEYLEKQRTLLDYDAAAAAANATNATNANDNDKTNIGDSSQATRVGSAVASNSSTLTTSSPQLDRLQLATPTSSPSPLEASANATPTTWRSLSQGGSSSSSASSSSSSTPSASNSSYPSERLVASSQQQAAGSASQQANQMTQSTTASAIVDGEADKRQPENLILATTLLKPQLKPQQDRASVDLDGEEYKFQIDYSKPPAGRRPCNPGSPEEAFLAAKSSELFLAETQNVLVNIINFVRFYLPCTNCAAHFSCMVEHSSGLELDLDARPQARTRVPDDSHLLWLWEAHNRVNERTRGTHSEDPTRPKHIFPIYEACPKCYLVEPRPNATFTEMRFHRRELVKFIVARYRRSAILNNKINIEDLYRKT